jgi:hypothetical protein
MRSIDVHDLPEPVARAIEGMVQSIRSQVSQSKNADNKPPRGTMLPSWSGNVIGELKRREIYDHVS